MRAAILFLITAICVWALAPYLPSPTEVFMRETPNEVESPERLKFIIPAEEIDLALIERQVFDLINEQREAENLNKLYWDEDLQVLAKSHSEWMASTENLVHSDANVYENIFWGINISQGRLSQTIFETWMGSKGHEKNILESSTHFGAIGIFENEDKRSIYATFMAK